MRFTIFTHVEHNFVDNSYFAYAPYVREMNIWIDKFDQIEIVAPLSHTSLTEVTLSYKHPNIKFNEIFAFNLLNLKSIIKSFGILPFNCYRIFKAMYNSDHIHIRTPGNTGLLASIIQIFFPFKKKTAKYAGNWDPKSKQPWSYKLQKWILKNSILTKNCKVLVYGKWSDGNPNILPFFTATFKEDQLTDVILRNYDEPIQFIFVGSLVEGKRPFFAVALVDQLNKKGITSRLDIYGEGSLKNQLIKVSQDNSFMKVHGGVSLPILKEIYKKAHFLILPSKSEGWPKAIAEAMFFGCIPIAPAISCVPFMLNYGKRGIIIEQDLDQAVSKVLYYLENKSELLNISKRAGSWSMEFTLEKFEREIANLI